MLCFCRGGPVQKVIEVERISDDGETAPVSYHGYHVNMNRDPALLVVDDRSGWGVRVTYDVGYGDAPMEVPAPVRQALLQMVTEMYQNRGVLETQLVRGVAELLTLYRLPGGLL